ICLRCDRFSPAKVRKIYTKIGRFSPPSPAMLGARGDLTLTGKERKHALAVPTLPVEVLRIKPLYGFLLTNSGNILMNRVPAHSIQHPSKF
ncbi:MAG TPA: hypothetical protein V6D48_26290, partial [Oculatellaceae cyanobacterium]